MIRASHVEPSAGAFGSAEKTERATIHRAEKTEKAEKAAAEVPAATSNDAADDVVTEEGRGEERA